MSPAERQTPPDQVVGDVGREQQTGRRGGRFVAIEREAVDDGADDGETAGQRVFRIEDRFFVFLQILVVAARQALHRRQKAHQMTDAASGLAAYQLQRIRVLL